ncbi:MAG: hypothetical protein WBH56_16985, partial [Bacteroidota bacterium]
LTGNPEFDPDLSVRLIMAIGGILMTGWTILLLWAVRRPIERRFVILLTAYPVVLGMFIISLLGYLDGRTSNLWILAKTVILMVSMTTSYVLSGKIRSQAEPSNHPRLRRFTVSKASLCPLDFAIETRHIVTTY